MKFAALFLATMATSAQAVTLADKWNITDPDFSYDSLTFKLDYTVSDYIGTGKGMVHFKLYDQYCAEGEPTDGNVTLLGDTNFTSLAYEKESGALGIKTATLSDVNNTFGDFTGANMDQAVSVNITLDADEISQNSALYTEDTSFGAVTAEIRFCVRFSLYTPNTVPTTVEVNFLETIVTLNVDLSDGFEIGSIAVEPKDRIVRTANQVYQVRAYQCDTNNAELSQAAKDATRNQGSVIRVCVTPDAEAFADGIKMRSIDSFEFVRDEGGANEVKQIAIANRLAALNLLTTYTDSACTGQDVCNFETILFASFYTSLGQVFGSGVASMQFGTDGKTTRRLREGASRELQQDAAAAAEFELEFGVNPVQEVFSGASATGALLGGILAVAVAMI